MADRSGAHGSARSPDSYDRIGRSYSATRRAEPLIAARIRDALGDARTVLNVGAGTGSYEPTDRQVLAAEPSRTMIAQRPPGSARAIRAVAEQLPLPDGSFDAALAVNTVHHWKDPRAGLRELRRIARRRIVLFVRDVTAGGRLWLTDDYLPALDPLRSGPSDVEAIEAELRPLRAIPIRLPRDCADGLFSAYWGRPEAYLDGAVRRNISNFARVPEADVAEGLDSLRAELASGEWDRKYGHLRSLPELDLGHRVLVAELA